MAHCKQALKRIRQSEKRRIRGKSLRNEIRTISKKIADAVQTKDPTLARSLLADAFSQIDKARKIHVYHANVAGRRKSQLALLVNTLGGSPQPAGASPAR